MKKPHNLKHLLLRPKLPSDDKHSKSSPFGYQPCKGLRCKTYKIIDTFHSFTSQTNKQIYTIVGRMTCHINNDVYQISCEYCTEAFIGQTSTPLHLTTKLMTSGQFVCIQLKS